MLDAAGWTVLPLLFVPKGHGLDLSSGPPHLQVSEVDRDSLYQRETIQAELAPAAAGPVAALTELHAIAGRRAEQA